MPPKVSRTKRKITSAPVRMAARKRLSAARAREAARGRLKEMEDETHRLRLPKPSLSNLKKNILGSGRRSLRRAGESFFTPPRLPTHYDFGLPKGRNLVRGVKKISGGAKKGAKKIINKVF